MTLFTFEVSIVLVSYVCVSASIELPLCEFCPFLLIPRLRDEEEVEICEPESELVRIWPTISLGEDGRGLGLDPSRISSLQ